MSLPEVDAVVVSLKSRSIAADIAVERSRKAEQWLRQRGANHILFKICSTFDSTDAGNIGPVMDALRADAQAPMTLVTPAFPETGRTVYQGNLFVGHTPLNESPLKDHPLNPMHDANLVRVLARQSATKVGLLALATVSQGPEAVQAALGALTEQGFGAAIADAVCERDLETLGRVALEHPVSVGASGLGLGLARALVVTGEVTAHARSAMRFSPVGGFQACLVGSCSQATLQQIARASQIMPVYRLDLARLFDGGDEVQRALDWAAARLGQGPVLVTSSSAPRDVADLQSLHGRDQSGHVIEQAMADIGQGLVEAGVRRLIVAGGETSGAVVDRLAIPGFAVGEEIAPGVPVLKTVGARQGDMMLALKSGNFGGFDFFSDALRLLD